MIQQRIKELEEMIDSFPPDYELIKKSLQAKVAVIKLEIENNYVPKWRSVSWSIGDFKVRAQQLAENKPERNYIFNESKFEYALEKMIDKHDATIGITWHTVDFYLMQYCLKSFERDDYESKLH